MTRRAFYRLLYLSIVASNISYILATILPVGSIFRNQSYEKSEIITENSSCSLMLNLPFSVRVKYELRQVLNEPLTSQD